MNKYKLIIAYDGTDYQGWQVQPHRNTIANTLQDRFFHVFNKRITLLGASRTDAGVHACGQVAIFRSDLSLTPEYLHKVWNDNLPASIVIRDLKLVNDRFHPHVNVHEKTYRYRLFLSRPLPDKVRYGWYGKGIQDVDIPLLTQALNLYLGTHNFRSFCKLDEEKDTIRTVNSIEISRNEQFLDIFVRGKSFLRYQIRRMVGYALDVARRPDLSLDDIRGMLKQPKAQQTLLKAKACGLSLMHIEYR